MKIFKESCKNCLLSSDSIVSPARRKEIVQGCIKNQTHFICHKATISGDKEIVCKTFFDKFGHHSQMIRIAERLNMIEYVEHTDQEKLPTYNEMIGAKGK